MTGTLTGIKLLDRNRRCGSNTMMPVGPAGSEPDCVPPAEVLAGVGSLVSHWDSAVPSCLWGCGDEILMGWWLL